LEDVEVNGRIILKCILRKERGSELNSSDSG
jgi:hypothetical protein